MSTTAGTGTTVSAPTSTTRPASPTTTAPAADDGGILDVLVDLLGG
jgi:hypothetical protein